MTVNPTALHLLVPDYPLDQIIGYHTGTISVGAGAPLTTVTDTYAHGFGDSCYVQGVFSTNGGTTWNDFGAMIPTAGPTLSTTGCNAYVNATNLNVVGYNYIAGTVTVLYKVYLLAKNTMANPVTPIATTQKLSFSSGFNFQQIATKGSLNLSVASGATGSVSVIHNLGYIPTVRVFAYKSGDSVTVYPIVIDADPGLSLGSQLAGGISSTQVELTSTVLTLFIDNSSAFSGGTITMAYDYRIYL